MYMIPTRKIYLKKLREKYVGKFFKEYLNGTVRDTLILKDVKKGYKEQLIFIFYSVKNNEEYNKVYFTSAFYREYYEYFYDYGTWGDKKYYCITLL